MKIREDIDYGFKSELQSHDSYSFFVYEMRIKQLENQKFIVPWQMVEPEKKEVLVE